MPLTRRAFVRSLGLEADPRVSGAFVAARGREALEAEPESRDFGERLRHFY